MPGFSGMPRRKSDRLRRERELADAIAAKVPRFNAHQVEEVDKLEHFLKMKFPRDLLMPVTHDTKKPAFRHRGSAWSWDEYKFCVKTDLVCILLRDLVVIDVDDDKQASNLEEKFPILFSVPCAKTARGRHYYFRRTVACDEEGFFDGAAQVVHGVDFKTVAETGTSGIVLVSPSVGKSWLIAPWDAELVPIPMALLNSVAVPVHPTVDIRIIFNAEEGDGTEAIVFRKNPWIRKMPFFDAIISGEFSASAAASSSSAPSDSTDSLGAALPPTIKLPEATVSWTSRDFHELLHFLDYGELNCVPTEEAKNNLEEFANFLLLSQRAPDKMALLRSPSIGRVAFQTDLLSISKRMCELDVDFVKIWRNNGSLEDTLVTINADLASSVNYVPLKKDNRWLFKRMPTIVDSMVTDGKNSEVKVFNRDPIASTQDTMPPALLAALTKYHDCLVVAGGSVVGGVGKYVSPGDDFDLFVYGINREQANALSDDVKKMFRATHPLVEVSSRAISFIPKDFDKDDKDKQQQSAAGKSWLSSSSATVSSAAVNSSIIATHPSDKKIVQIILKLYVDRSEVLGSFDMAPCKVLARCTADGSLVIEALPIFVECMRNMAFYSDSWSRWAPSSITRIFKYVSKGFEVMIPGLLREAFVTMPKKKKYEAGDFTLRGLLDAEGEALRVFSGKQPKSGKKGGFMMRPSWMTDVVFQEDAAAVIDAPSAATSKTAAQTGEAALAWISHRLSKLYFGTKESPDAEGDGADADVPTGEAVKPEDNMRMWLPYDRLQDQIVSDACCEDIYDKAKLFLLEEMKAAQGPSARLEPVESDDEDEEEEDFGENEDDDEFEGFGDGYNFF